MRVINFGSLNIDHVYQVDHFVKAGETIGSSNYSVFSGGKGANQSLAVARAGGRVLHVGNAGNDAAWLVRLLRDDGVDTSAISLCEKPSGHAIIQVDKNGQNAIVVFGGANQTFTRQGIAAALSGAQPDDTVLIQNEINELGYIIDTAAGKGLHIVLNPAPMGPNVASLPLEKVGTFVINEIEGEALCSATQPNQIITAMRVRFPHAACILTLGSNGACYADSAQSFSIPACKVTAVDTTAAGDTFVGYYLAGLQKGLTKREALQLATSAAAISVTKHGAASSIPYLHEVNEAQHKST